MRTIIVLPLTSCVTLQDKEIEQAIEDSSGCAPICMTNKDGGFLGNFSRTESS